MSEKRWLFFALGVTTVISVGAVTNQLVPLAPAGVALSDTGITFPDGTVQTTAAAAHDLQLGLRGSRLWLLTDWSQSNQIGYSTVVNIKYLGNAAGTNVWCHWFQGTTPILEEGPYSQSPGSHGLCNSQGLGDAFGFGWMVVESDEPVFAVASRWREGSTFARERNVPMIPIDCANPQGYELACSLLTE